MGSPDDPGTPIYDALSAGLRVIIPDRLEDDPVHALLAATSAMTTEAPDPDPDQMPPEDDEHAHGDEDDPEEGHVLIPQPRRAVA